MLGREFQKLWVGQSISAVGSSITQFALPLTAALTLEATPEQMGVLTAATWLPYLLFGLLAGAWSDRLRRRPILIVTDVVRAAVLGTIPLAAALHVLTIAQVLVVAFVAGSMTVVFQSAYRPYIPFLVGRDALVQANSRLALSESVARVAGPSLGGLLVQLITAPIAIAADALSFVVSAVAVSLIRATETLPPKSERRSIWTEMGEGIRVAFANRFIRTVLTMSFMFNFAITMGDAVFILYVTRQLGLDAAHLGVVFTVGGLASVGGAAIVSRYIARLGIGPGVVTGLLTLTIGGTLVLVAGGGPDLATVYISARAALFGFSAAVINVTTGTVAQAAIPDRLQGRVGGAAQLISLGLIPVSALLGGWLGSNVGLWNTLALSVGAQLAAFLYVVTSPLRGIKTARDVMDVPASAGAVGSNA
ncbi:MAG TPA: MFS transporter [Candidatus Limnocylindria bacterium]